MRGKALKTVSTPLEARSFHALAARMLALLRVEIPSARFEPISLIADTLTFDELVLVVCWGEGEDAHARKARAVSVLEATEVAEAGHVMNVSLPPDALQAPFRIHFIQCQANAFEFVLAYYGFNEIGSLMKQLAFLMGFELSHNGLQYRLHDARQGDRHLGWALVTRDWRDALQFLGYDAVAFQRLARSGFRTPQDVFRFVATSQFFDVEANLPRDAGHVSSVEASGRTALAAFMRWLDTPGTRPADGTGVDWPDGVGVRRACLNRGLLQFPAFRDHFRVAMEQAEQTSRALNRLDEKRVGALTGASWEEVAKIMKAINYRFENRSARCAWMAQASEQDIDTLVRKIATSTRLQWEREARARAKLDQSSNR